MNAKEYEKYEQAVADFFEREGIQNLSHGRITCSECGAKLHETGACDEKCPSCGTDCEMMNEPYFSWRHCECCGSHLGGDRHPASGYCPPEGGGPGGECFEYEVCTDCIYYATYGQLDDQTMMDIEDSKEQEQNDG